MVRVDHRDDGSPRLLLPRRAAPGWGAGDGTASPSSGASARDETPPPARSNAAPSASAAAGSTALNQPAAKGTTLKTTEHERVEHDLPRRLAVAADDGRRSGFRSGRVVALDQEREHPECAATSRRKTIREERERGPGERAGGSGPADERRNRAGRAADDDVLPSIGALQPAHVHDHVERVPDQRQRCREEDSTELASSANEDADRASPTRARRPGADALEFGLALSAFSFALLASSVNLLTATLALVGNLFLRGRVHALAEAHPRRRTSSSAARPARFRRSSAAAAATGFARPGPRSALFPDRLPVDAAALLGARAA